MDVVIELVREDVTVGTTQQIWTEEEDERLRRYLRPAVRFLFAQGGGTMYLPNIGI